MFRLANPYFLYLLLLIPLYIGLFMLARYNRKKKLEHFGSAEIINRLFPNYSSVKGILKMILLSLVWACLVLAAANPQSGSKLERIQRKGIDLVFVLDVSNSMLAEDITPNRLARAKQAISSLVDQLEDDRIGLVVFAGDAYVQMPVTTDFAATRLYLDNISPASVPVQGTAIGKAIEKASECFTDSRKSKAIILITDGENHEDDAIEAAKTAASGGIKVYSIGMGSSQGAPIPVYNGNMIIGYKKDNAGATVISKLDESLLKQIAEAGKGIFIRANNSSAGVKEVFNHISNLEKNEFDAKVFSDYEDRFGIFLFIGLMLLIIQMMIPDRKFDTTHFMRFKSLLKKNTLIAIILSFFLAGTGSVMAQQTQKIIRQGNKKYKENKFKEAEIDYRKALEKDTTSLKASYNLGNSLYKQKQYEEAAKAYLTGMTGKASPEMLAGMYHNLGNSYLQAKKYNESILAYKQSLRLNPKDEDTRYNLAYAQAQLKKQQQEEKKNEEQQKQNQQAQPNPEPKEQQQKDPKMSKDDAERMLKALNNNEKKSLQKAKQNQQKAIRSAQPEKDW